MQHSQFRPKPIAILMAAIAASSLALLSGCAGAPPIAGSPGPIKRYHDEIGREKLKKSIIKTAGKPVSGFGSSGFSPGHGVSPYFTRGDQLPKKIALVTYYVYDPGTVDVSKGGNMVVTTTTWVSEKNGNILANKFLQASIGPLKQVFEKQGMQLLTLDEAIDSEEKRAFYKDNVSLELSKGLVGAIRKFIISVESGDKKMIMGADGYRVFDVSAAWDWKRSIALGSDLAGSLGVDAVLGVGLGVSTNGDIYTLDHIKWAVNGKNPNPKKEGWKYVSQNLGTGYYEGQCYFKADVGLLSKKGGIPFYSNKTKEENFEGFDLFMTVLAEATGQAFSEAVAKNSK